jgi:hypothetical protein
LGAELFCSEVWFVLLLARGFERAPQRANALPLPRKHINH